MMRDHDANQRRKQRLNPLITAAVAVTAAAIGIALALILLKTPGSSAASASGDPAGSSPGGYSAGGIPSSGTQGGNGGGLPALPPLSGGGGGGLQLMLQGKVLAISSTSITLGGNGPDIVAKITGSTQVTGNVTSVSGIKVGDQVAAEVSGQSSADMTAVQIQDPGQAP
jgi:hypothetical protein